MAILERLGRPVSTEPLGPGLHLVAPWPIDNLRRVPIHRVMTMTIGAEHGEEEEEEEEGDSEEEHHEGPEHTLWAKMHADEEYTLLLGDGRDLVTLDGLLHYQVADPYIYLYGSQNPEHGLKAVAYEALTRRTVDRSLDAVLSENLSVFADEVVAAIRQRAEDLELGLEPVSFTLKGLHPPFAVAKDYPGRRERANGTANGCHPGQCVSAPADSGRPRRRAARCRRGSRGHGDGPGPGGRRGPGVSGAGGELRRSPGPVSVSPTDGNA